MFSLSQYHRRPQRTRTRPIRDATQTGASHREVSIPCSSLSWENTDKMRTASDAFFGGGVNPTGLSVSQRPAFYPLLHGCRPAAPEASPENKISGRVPLMPSPSCHTTVAWLVMRARPWHRKKNKNIGIQSVQMCVSLKISLWSHKNRDSMCWGW